jgi:hypothetical protein
MRVINNQLLKENRNTVLNILVLFVILHREHKNNIMSRYKRKEPQNHFAPKGKKWADYTGKKFGKLLCIGRAVGDGNWRYKCDCGKSIVVNGFKIHWRKSCGCLNAENALKRGSSMRKYDAVTITCEYLMYKNNAKQRNWGVLQKSDWLKIVMQPCYYCGETDTRNRATMESYLRTRGKSLKPEEVKLYEVKMNGIDRVDSLRGYVLNNMVPCCGVCNRMKNNFSNDVFMDKIKKIYEKHLVD